ncbi:hypothetical protein GW796_09665 [archaeon]|nr:hypothetical protein [archaeon]
MGIFIRKPKSKNDDIGIQRKAVLELELREIAELALAGIDCDQLPNAVGSFGKYHRNPIVTNGENGTMIYLGKLYFGDIKNKILFHKIGEIPNLLTNMGNIDIYELVDESFKHWDILFIDKFHPRRSNFVPLGYSFEEYNEDYGDMNKCLGVKSFCKNFPNGLVTSLISESNSRYMTVENLIRDYEKSGCKIIKNEEHQIKIDAIKGLLISLKKL